MKTHRLDPWGVFWFGGNLSGAVFSVYIRDATLFMLSFSVTVLVAIVLWKQATGRL